MEQVQFLIAILMLMTTGDVEAGLVTLVEVEAGKIQ